jgi:hypothetical protein
VLKFKPKKQTSFDEKEAVDWDKKRAAKLQHNSC